MGDKIKHPVTGETIGRIENKEIKDLNTGKVTGRIEKDEGEEYLERLGAGIVAGSLYLAGIIMYVAFYGLFGACGLIGKKRTAVIGIVFILITTALIIMGVWASSTGHSSAADIVGGIWVLYILIILPISVWLFSKGNK